MSDYNVCRGGEVHAACMTLSEAQEAARTLSKGSTGAFEVHDGKRRLYVAVNGVGKDIDEPLAEPRDV